MASGTRVAIYVRVSTKEQSTEMQKSALREVASAAKWTVTGLFTDHGFSGALGPADRPGLRALIESASRREFNKVLVWSVDRLGRSVKDLIATLHQLHDCGIDLYAHQQALDTSTTTGRMMWQFLAIFADFEREMIRERVLAGIARAKHQGVKFGRPSQSEKLEQAVLKLGRKGFGKVRIGRQLGLGTGTVSRILAAHGP